MLCLLCCFPGAPLWDMYFFIEKSHYFCKKKKEAQAQQLKPVSNASKLEIKSKPWISSLILRPMGPFLSLLQED